MTNEFSEHDLQNLTINTQKQNSFFESLYNFSAEKFQILRKYLNKHLKNDFITSFKSCAAAFIFFIKKRMICDYVSIIENSTQSSSKIDIFCLS